MRAVVVHEVGGPEALRVDERAEPEPGPGEVRVDVAAAGVNFIDVYQRDGRYPLPLPFVAGPEGAGTVAAVGDGVADVAVGDRVAWAMVAGTGYAEQVTVAADRVVPVPDGVDTETAAAVMLQGMTAHYLCDRHLPRCATGTTSSCTLPPAGVGLLLTQMASPAAPASSARRRRPEKAELARGAGAGDVVARLRRARTSRRGSASSPAARGWRSSTTGWARDTFDGQPRPPAPARHDGAVRRVQRAGAAGRPDGARREGLVVPDAARAGALRGRARGAAGARRRRLRLGGRRHPRRARRRPLPARRGRTVRTRTSRPGAPPASCCSCRGRPDRRAGARP